MTSEEIQALQQQIINVSDEKKRYDALVEELHMLLATKQVVHVSLTFNDGQARHFDVKENPENGQRMLQYLIAHYSKKAFDLIKVAKELMDKQNN